MTQQLPRRPGEEAVPRSIGDQSPGQMMNEAEAHMDPTTLEPMTQTEERISEPLRTPTEGMQERWEPL